MTLLPWNWVPMLAKTIKAAISRYSMSGYVETLDRSSKR